MPRAAALLSAWARPSQIVISQGPPDLAAGGARSYLDDGRAVRWSPPPRSGILVAVDAEIADRLVPEALARRFGVEDPAVFWPTWTQVEVTCKLRDVPLLAWLSRHGLRPDTEGALTRTMRVSDVVVCCGVLQGGSRMDLGSCPTDAGPTCPGAASRG